MNERAGFTVGKIYKFVDGQCFDDQNDLRPITDAKCDDLSRIGEVFIPIVEYCRMG